MTNKSDKEKAKLVQDKCQQILAELLKDDDNKYCVDCDAKGPRWTSWNLGVFLCIRCAGIHRNLGVHISKVKSVNLDVWSAEQIGYLKQTGNSKARAIYEANLPDNFRRPQSDSALEAFIRAKYEHKKYIAKEWVEPPTPPPAFDIEEERKKEKEKKKHKLIKPANNSSIIEVQTNPVPRPQSNSATNIINADKVPTSKESYKLNADFLGLSTPQKPLQGNNLSSNTNDDDGFDAFVSAAPLQTSVKSTPEVATVKTNEEEDFFNQKQASDDVKKPLDKESILKLYQSSNPLTFSMGTNPLQPTPLKTLSPQQQSLPFGNNPITSLSNNNTNNGLTDFGFANFNQPIPSAASPYNSTSQNSMSAFNSIQNSQMQANTATNPFLSGGNTNTTSTTGADILGLGGSSVNHLQNQLNGLQLNSNTSSTFTHSSSTGNLSNLASLSGLNLNSSISTTSINWANSLAPASTLSNNNNSNTANPFLQQTTTTTSPTTTMFGAGNNTSAFTSSVDPQNDWSNFNSGTQGTLTTANLLQ